jgi:hypothetical protein
MLVISSASCCPTQPTWYPSAFPYAKYQYRELYLKIADIIKLSVTSWSCAVCNILDAPLDLQVEHARPMMLYMDILAV